MAKRNTGRESSVKSGRSTGRKSSVRAGRRSTGRARAVAPKGSGHELIPVVCSDCFEEFAFDTGTSGDTLTCPVCEHSVSRPDDGVLHRVHSHRGDERTNAMVSLALLGLGMLGWLAWVVLAGNPATEGAGFWGPLGLAILAALGLIVFTFRYEGNRWEVYF